jgi:hypothetical protein
MEPGSSVGIVSDCRQEERTMGAPIAGDTENFSSSHCVQTGSRAHLASCTMGTGGPFPGGKVPTGCNADHSPNLVPRSRISRSYTSSPPPPKRRHGMFWDNSFFTNSLDNLFSKSDLQMMLLSSAYGGGGGRWPFDQHLMFKGASSSKDA